MMLASTLDNIGILDAAVVALLGYGIAVVENLELSGVWDGDYILFAAPLKIDGGEAAPCRAVLLDMQLRSIDRRNAALYVQPYSVDPKIF